MATDKQKSLNEVAGTSEHLQAAYDALLAFSPSSVADSANVDGGYIQQMATQEATVESLLGGEHGITAGLKGVLRRAATPSLSKWLTMRSKFNSAIQPYMDKINAVRDFESKKSAIEAKMLDRESKIIAEAEANKPYGDAKMEKEVADRHFDELIQGEGGRPVNSFGHTWLYVILMFGITGIEWLINYSAFFAWTAVPAIAAGFTIGMALAVALAAHVHGEYLKQRNSRFGPAAETKGRDYAFLGLATLGLIVAVVVAGWARYSLAMHSIGAQGPMIELNNIVAAPVNPLTDVYFSLGINMIVWLIGLVIAFMGHDENHDLMRAKLEQYRKTKRFNSLHKPWENRIQLVKAQGSKELDQLRAGTQLAKNAIKIQRDMVDHVEERESAIYRVLANHLQSAVDLYRFALGNGLVAQRHIVIVGDSKCTGEQYKQLAINIDGETLRTLLN